MDQRNIPGRGESLSFLASVASSQFTSLNTVMNQQPLLTTQQIPLNAHAAYHAVASQAFIPSVTQTFLPSQTSSATTNANYMSNNVAQYPSSTPNYSSNSLVAGGYANMTYTSAIQQQHQPSVFPGQTVPATLLQHPALHTTNTVQQTLALQQANSGTPLPQNSVQCTVANQLPPHVNSLPVHPKKSTCEQEIPNGTSQSRNVSIGTCLKVPQIGGQRGEECTEMFHTIREALSVADNSEPSNNTANNANEEQHTHFLASYNTNVDGMQHNNSLSNFNAITTSTSQIICRHCNFNTNYRMVFMRHMVCHFPQKGYECPLCPLMFQNEILLKEHVSEHIGAKWIPSTRTSRKNSLDESNVGDDLSNKSMKTKGKSDCKARIKSPTSCERFKRKSPKSYMDHETANTTLKHGASSYMNFYNNMDKVNSPNFNREANTNPYDPIDPISTTNKSLNYADFYKKQGFMNNNKTPLPPNSPNPNFSNNSQLCLTNNGGPINGNTLQNGANFHTMQNQLYQRAFNNGTYSNMHCQSEPLSLIVRQAVDNNHINSQSYNNSRTSNMHQRSVENPTKMPGSSEHITVKIDPYDVAPSMMASNKTQTNAPPPPQDIPNQTGLNEDSNDVIEFIERDPDESNSRSSSSDISDIQPPPAGKLSSNGTGDGQKNSKTQTSKYSVNFPISNQKNRGRIGVKKTTQRKRIPGGWYRSNLTKVKSKGKKSGSKIVKRAMKNPGTPCSLEDIMELTVATVEIGSPTIVVPLCEERIEENGEVKLDESKKTTSINISKSNTIFTCRICKFETQYKLVFARHAPSHVKIDGVIK